MHSRLMYQAGFNKQPGNIPKAKHIKLLITNNSLNKVIKMDAGNFCNSGHDNNHASGKFVPGFLKKIKLTN